MLANRSKKEVVLMILVLWQSSTVYIVYCMLLVPYGTTYVSFAEVFTSLFAQCFSETTGTHVFFAVRGLKLGDPIMYLRMINGNATCIFPAT